MMDCCWPGSNGGRPLRGAVEASWGLLTTVEHWLRRDLGVIMTVAHIPPPTVKGMETPIMSQGHTAERVMYTS